MNTPMPALFIGHGNPMNAIEETVYAAAWREAVASIPRPTAILCISAHWETEGTYVTAMAQPKTIHDFYGFPDALHLHALGQDRLMLRTSSMISAPSKSAPAPPVQRGRE